jgi:hypothetical protein
VELPVKLLLESEPASILELDGGTILLDVCYENREEKEMFILIVFAWIVFQFVLLVFVSCELASRRELVGGVRCQMFFPAHARQQLTCMYDRSGPHVYVLTKVKMTHECDLTQR